MNNVRWRRLLARHPEVRAVLDQLIRENPKLQESRDVLGLPVPSQPAVGRWRPFTQQEMTEARSVGWN